MVKESFEAPLGPIKIRRLVAMTRRDNGSTSPFVISASTGCGLTKRTPSIGAPESVGPAAGAAEERIVVRLQGASEQRNAPYDCILTQRECARHRADAR